MCQAVAHRGRSGRSEADGESPDLVGQSNGLVERHECRAVVEFDQSSLREEVGESDTMAARHGSASSVVVAW
jgi:hypothetical protein